MTWKGIDDLLKKGNNYPHAEDSFVKDVLYPALDRINHYFKNVDNQLHELKEKVNDITDRLKEIENKVQQQEDLLREGR